MKKTVSLLLILVFVLGTLSGCETAVDPLAGSQNMQASNTESGQTTSAQSAAPTVPTTIPTQPTELVTVYCLEQIRVWEYKQSKPVNHVFTYDENGMLLIRSKTVGDKSEKVEEFRYDENGNLIYCPHKDHQYIAVTSTYDAQGRLLTQSWYEFAQREEAYTYDDAGNLILEEHKKNGQLTRHISMTYSDKGWLLEEVWDYVSENHPDIFIYYEYDENGNLLSEITYYDEILRSTITCTYDDNGNMATYQSIRDGEIAQDKTFFYDEQGNLIRTESYERGIDLTTEPEPLRLIVVTYQYDENGNLLEKDTRDEEGRGSTIRWTYDDSGNMLSEELVGSNRTEWTYDEWGNVLTYRYYVGDDLRYDITYSYTAFQVTPAQAEAIRRLQDDYLDGMSPLLR